MFVIIWAIIISYLFGAIPNGFIAARLVKGIDIRNYGSGNIGATNVFRVVGKVPGILVLVADILKGLIVTRAIPEIFGPSAGLTVACGLFAVIGHNWPVYLKFRGGKGVAATLGVALGINWLAGVLAIGVWIILLLLSRRVSVSSLGLGITLPLFILVATHDALFTALAVVLGVLIIWRHQANIRRLISGEEQRIFE